MKAHLNLTIDERLLVEVKQFAQKNDTNVSELVEKFFKKLLVPSKSRSIVEFVEKLEQSALDPSTDLKQAYYHEKGDNYGS